LGWIEKRILTLGVYPVEKSGMVFRVFPERRGVFWCLFFGLLPFILSGCGPKVSTPQQLNEFDISGPVATEADTNALTGMRSYVGPYRVIRGDILKFQMPTILRIVSSDLSEWLKPSYGHMDVEAYYVRISQKGTVTLPIIGEIRVVGKTLAEIEGVVIDAYYPKYVVTRPMVVCEVSHYQGENKRIFAVIGLVNKPGTYPYPSDVQYNLMEAIAYAEGLDMVADPKYVKLYRQDASGKVVDIVFKIDNKTMKDAYALIVKPGDVIYVDHTLQTRINKLLSDALRITINAGADVRYGGD
jgi:polysaccharide export outer membrane protein